MFIASDFVASKLVSLPTIYRDIRDKVRAKVRFEKNLLQRGN